jgi:threonyl-tRNA synthetase
MKTPGWAGPGGSIQTKCVWRIPEAQCGIGPPTDEGFFYDFVVRRPFVPEDLDAIEQKMREFGVVGKETRFTIRRPFMTRPC